ncbi:uncharacterized protein [Epargyreus clarus]|uniref:uncharacterized protein n=1 Tax=Epargyreus clarus TaxID=520877 RepID=UPI003C2FDCB0
MLWHVLSIAAVVVSVAGHGRVLEPPGRASMWRMGFSTPPNYDDDGLNCGGFHHQYAVNGGKCGICGDPFDMPEPRAHEIGGTYGSGEIVAHYDQGQVITVTVELSAYHKGYWEFRICKDPKRNDQECFEEYILELEDGGTKYYPWQDDTYTMKYRLPADLVCEHCVLQWRYTAGNNWGHCRDGSEGLGCGNQENFGACSDISIGPFERTPDAPVEIPEPIPVCITNSIVEIEGIIELIRKVAVRPRQAPKRNTPILNQRQNNRRKQRREKRRPRKKKKMWIFT